ncbi:unnamed protein product [Rotaria magnacalcarata]|uniref:Uncharacterized protein n=1 Tax=Rotaria magnacalcarata TaxID=392030 RepID=A0A816VX48_9BILA|nr:unnamed protein product [Rotaria magnacalcarata]
MSSVPVQFLIYVMPQPSCTIAPIIIPLAGCLEVKVGVMNTFNITVANQCDPDIADISDLIVSNGITGMQAGNLSYSPTNDSFVYVIFTWTPQLSQLGPQTLCTIAFTEPLPPRLLLARQPQRRPPLQLPQHQQPPQIQLRRQPQLQLQLPRHQQQPQIQLRRQPRPQLRPQPRLQLRRRPRLQQRRQLQRRRQQRRRRQLQRQLLLLRQRRRRRLQRHQLLRRLQQQPQRQQRRQPRPQLRPRPQAQHQQQLLALRRELFVLSIWKNDKHC